MELLTITVIFAVLVSTSAAAEPSFVSDGKVSVCTTANFPPLTFKNSPGDAVPVGIDIEIADALAKEWNANTAFTTTDFAGLLPALGAGRCGVIISGIYINDERRKAYDGVSYMKSATVIVTRASDNKISNPETLSGKTIALESGTYYKAERIDPLNKLLAATGKPAVVVQDYPAQQAAYQQVMVGRADATLTEQAEGAARVAAVKDELRIAYTWKSDFTYGIYMRRNANDLAMVRAAFKKLHDSGFFKTLAAKYGLDPSVFDVNYNL